MKFVHLNVCLQFKKQVLEGILMPFYFSRHNFFLTKNSVVTFQVSSSALDLYPLIHIMNELKLFYR